MGRRGCTTPFEQREQQLPCGHPSAAVSHGLHCFAQDTRRSSSDHAHDLGQAAQHHNGVEVGVFGARGLDAGEKMDVSVARSW